MEVESLVQEIVRVITEIILVVIAYKRGKKNGGRK
jgi:hypothetical protein